MYKLRKIRSRKSLYNLSTEYKRKLERTIHVSHHEMLNIAKTKRQFVKKNVSTLNHDSINSSAMQEFQTVELAGDSSVIKCDVTNDLNLNNTLDLTNENKDLKKSKDIEESLFSENMNFEEQLASVFVKTKITHVQAKEILKLLKIHPCFSNLPNDPRTILNCPRTSCSIDEIADGHYLHLGFEEGIKSILKITSLDMIPNNLEIDFHIDGVSLYDASNFQMYPIQIRIANIYQSKPEIVGIWKGMSKPTSAVELLKPFVNDVLKVRNNNGIIFHGRKLTFSLRCFIADAVCRAFVLGHQGHKSRVPCSKCWIIGESIRQGVMVYSGIEHRLRTNEEYIACLDGEHHIEGESSIARLSINLVKQTVFDYMHLVCLGVMEKIFLAIINGKYASSAKISSSSAKILSDRLELMKQFCPKEFARKPINIAKHRTFKATEHRQILLYTGPVIFLGLMNEAMYLHFLLLHSAIRILVDAVCSRNTIMINKAEVMLKIFVKRVAEHYGVEFISYNVHGLLHLSDDVRNYGPLDSFSAFPYENNMRYFRKMCRKPNQHLQQIANRRYEEKMHLHRTYPLINDSIKVSGVHKNGLILTVGSQYRNCFQYRNLSYKKFFLSLNGRDDTIILEDSSICILQNILKDNKKYYLIVKRFNKVTNFFNTLVPSSEIGIFHCSLLSHELIVINLDQVVGKCFKLPLCDNIDQTRNSNCDYVIATILSSCN